MSVSSGCSIAFPAAPCSWPETKAEGGPRPLATALMQETLKKLLTSGFQTAQFYVLQALRE